VKAKALMTQNPVHGERKAFGVGDDLAAEHGRAENHVDEYFQAARELSPTAFARVR
jgi:hypothetical protein